MTNDKLLGIIPTYRGFDYARIAAESFLATTDGDVLIVDDGSPDWVKIKWQDWPSKRLHKFRYAKNDKNLTRSWNYGLRFAKTHGFKYAMAGNSDVLFVEGWWEPIKRALDAGWDLAGPLTNAPGPKKRQQIKEWIDDYRLTDDTTYIRSVLAQIAKNDVIPELINGFCMLAPVASWWKNSFDDEHVFDPKHKMTRNEDELQGRWHKAGARIGVVASSFVFHYRGVSRGSGGAGRYRLKKK